MKHTNVAEIRHDAFARESLVRRVIRGRATCAWCGGRRSRAGGEVPSIFEYGIRRDDSLFDRTAWDGRYFCSLSCRKSHYS
jgi:hypothetical protein